MRRIVLGLLIAVVAVTASPVYAGVKDNLTDKIGDWVVTVGKPESEKQAIVANRKAKRVAKRADEAANRAAKKVKKELKKTNEEANEAFNKITE